MQTPRALLRRCDGQPRRRRLTRLLLAAWLALFPGCSLDERFVFHPSATITRTPREVGLKFEDVFFTTADGVRLHGWFVPHPEPRSNLLWFHGNAGNISHRIENIRLLHDQVSVNVFIFDYRGYGLSQGRPSEAGSYLDGEAALGVLRSKLGWDPGQIVLFGRSLGAAIAVEVATRFDVQALILESPFVSLAEMARAVLPFVPLATMLQSRYDVRGKIKNIKAPLLVLHGDRDAVVPFSQGKAVFDAAPEPKRFVTITGAGHNDTYMAGGEEYFRRLSDFIAWTAGTGRSEATR